MKIIKELHKSAKTVRLTAHEKETIRTRLLTVCERENSIHLKADEEIEDQKKKKSLVKKIIIVFIICGGIAGMGGKSVVVAQSINTQNLGVYSLFFVSLLCVILLFVTLKMWYSTMDTAMR